MAANDLWVIYSGRILGISEEIDMSKDLVRTIKGDQLARGLAGFGVPLGLLLDCNRQSSD